MAQVTWSLSAQVEFESIAQFIALENPAAASRFVEKVLRATRQLARFPKSGSRIPELPEPTLRQLAAHPCRIFYQMEGDQVRILWIMRYERLFQKEYLGL